MRKRNFPLLDELQDILLIGFENDDDGNDDDDDDDDEGDEGGKSKGDEDQDAGGLKSALQKERRARKAAERERNKLAREKKEREEAEASDADKVKARADSAEARAAALATKLREKALENQIQKHAGEYNFVDMDDVLGAIKAEDIDIEQDEDDPSDIEVDEASVKAALKSLAERKPHWVGKTQEGTPKSGSKNAGNNGKKTKEPDRNEELRKQYPALRRSAPAS